MGENWTRANTFVHCLPQTVQRPSPSSGTECVESFLRGPESGGGGWDRHCKWTGKCGVNFRRGRESEGTSFQICWIIPLFSVLELCPCLLWLEEGAFMYYRHIFP